MWTPTLLELKHNPSAWVYDRIACWFPQPDELQSRRLRDQQAYRGQNWFFQYVGYDSAKGRATFDVFPPGMPRSRHKWFAEHISNLYNAYEMLYEDSVLKTLVSTYQRMSARDLVVDSWVIPHSWVPKPLIGTLRPFIGTPEAQKPTLFGAAIHRVDSYNELLGAFSDHCFRQYEPLLPAAADWEWINEGPVAVLERFA